MAAHTYWRIYITATNGGSVASIAELQMYDAAGTLLATGGTAIASRFYAPDSAVAARAFDADYGSFWSSGSVPSVGSPQWLKYQFASAADVAVVRITYRSGTISQAPSAFSIQWSD